MLEQLSSFLASWLFIIVISCSCLLAARATCHQRACLTRHSVGQDMTMSERMPLHTIMGPRCIK